MSPKGIILITLIYVSFSFGEDTCGFAILTQSQGVIDFYSQEPSNKTCTWIILVPYDMITTIRILQTNVKIAFDYNKSTKYVTKPGLLSIRSTRIRITLKEDRIVHMHIQFTVRSTTICPNSDFICLDQQDCFNKSHVCDNAFQCADHSDELNCRDCFGIRAPCDLDSAMCFNLLTERCNGENNCLTGVDEERCTEDMCASKETFLCENGRCIKQFLINNGKDDCGDLSDEPRRDLIVSKSTLIVITCVLFVILFLTLVTRWYLKRDHLHRLFRQPPDFPLPPFHGPGDRGFSDSDYRSGGDIFEAYMQCRFQIDQESRRQRTTEGQKKTKPLIMPLSMLGDTDQACLAGLGVPEKVYTSVTKANLELIDDKVVHESKQKEAGDVSPEDLEKKVSGIGMEDGWRKSEDLKRRYAHILGDVGLTDDNAPGKKLKRKQRKRRQCDEMQVEFLFTNKLSSESFWKGSSHGGCSELGDPWDVHCRERGKSDLAAVVNNKVDMKLMRSDTPGESTLSSHNSLRSEPQSKCQDKITPVNITKTVPNIVKSREIRVVRQSLLERGSKENIIRDSRIELNETSDANEIVSKSTEVEISNKRVIKVAKRRTTKIRTISKTSFFPSLSRKTSISWLLPRKPMCSAKELKRASTSKMMKNKKGSDNEKCG